MIFHDRCFVMAKFSGSDFLWRRPSFVTGLMYPGRFLKETFYNSNISRWHFLWQGQYITETFCNRNWENCINCILYIQFECFLYVYKMSPDPPSTWDLRFFQSFRHKKSLSPLSNECDFVACPGFQTLISPKQHLEFAIAAFQVTFKPDFLELKK